MRKQKGQDMVEFAILLPLFLMILLGIIYSGFFFSDYLTLNNIARYSARHVELSDTLPLSEDVVKDMTSATHLYHVTRITAERSGNETDKNLKVSVEFAINEGDSLHVILNRLGITTVNQPKPIDLYIYDEEDRLKGNNEVVLYQQS